MWRMPPKHDRPWASAWRTAAQEKFMLPLLQERGLRLYGFMLEDCGHEARLALLQGVAQAAVLGLTFFAGYKIGKKRLEG